MKKKILITSLICLFCFMSLMEVFAEGVYHPTLLSISRGKSAEVEIYGSKETHKGIFYKQKINGYWALCLTMGNTSRSSYEFTKKLLSDVNIYPYETIYQIKRAYEFIYKYTNLIGSTTNPEDFDLIYVIAQLYTWIVQIDDINVYERKEVLYKSTISAYCSAFYKLSSGTKDCSINGETYNIISSGKKQNGDPFSSSIYFYISKLFETTPSNSRKYAIYSSNVSGSQPLLGTYGKDVSETTPGTPGEETKTCELKVESELPDSCNDDIDEGYITNKTDWSCLYERIKSNDSTSTQYLVDDSNKYCKVYCMDTIKSYLPYNGVTVDQGKYMTVGKINSNSNNIYPISYDGTRECRPNSAATGKIDVEQFKKDVVAVDNQISAKWDATQIKYGEWQAATGSTCQVTNPQYKCKHSLDPSTEQKNQCMSDANAWADGEVAKHFKNNPGETRSRDEIHAIKYNEYYNYCISNLNISCKSYYTQSTCTGSSTNGVYGNIPVTFTVEEGKNTRESKIGEYESAYRQAYNDYLRTVQARNNIISSINSCTQMVSGIKFNDFDPNLEINYEEPIYGNMSSDGWDLIGSLSENKKIDYYIGGDAITGTSTSKTTNVNDGILKSLINVHICDQTGQKCITTQREYYKTTWWELYYNKKYDYQLEDGVYRYVEKGSGQSVHNITNYNIEYVDIGFSNLPIHYSTDPGNYDYTITTNSLGNGNRFNEEFNMSNIYSCQYNVSCDDTIQNNSLTQFRADCPGTTTNITGSGLNVVYRTISLYSKEKAFPGLNGTGRTPGDNWNNDTLINTYIVNNRGVTDYEVYHLDPMYEIELTPSMMKLFRQYNKKKNREVVTMYSSSSAATSGIAGYSDFSNMRCNSDGTHCVSSLLRGNVTGYTQIKITGCAISNSGIYGNCGSNNQAW